MQQTIRSMVFFVGLAIGAIAQPFQVPAAAGDHADKVTGSIDIASIVNFSEPGTKLPGATSNEGMHESPSVVISGRSKTPSNEWERYRMESAPQDRKGGILAEGLIAAFRIPINWPRSSQ